MHVPYKYTSTLKNKHAYVSFIQMHSILNCILYIDSIFLTVLYLKYTVYIFMKSHILCYIYIYSI